MIGLLERRLDIIVYRLNFVPTVFAARQFINHGHVLVNGKRVNKGQLSFGDEIKVGGTTIRLEDTTAIAAANLASAAASTAPVASAPIAPPSPRRTSRGASAPPSDSSA